MVIKVVKVIIHDLVFKGGIMTLRQKVMYSIFIGLAILTVASLPLFLTGCDNIGERLIFNVSLNENILSLCTSINLSPQESREVSDALGGASSATVYAIPNEVWNAKTFEDLVRIIEAGSK